MTFKIKQAKEFEMNYDERKLEGALKNKEIEC